VKPQKTKKWSQPASVSRTHDTSGRMNFLCPSAMVATAQSRFGTRSTLKLPVAARSRLNRPHTW